MAAFDVVSAFGQAARPSYDNFYFFTAKPTRLVMYGPDRPDHLMFYRHTAPANLDISKEGNMKDVDPLPYLPRYMLLLSI